MRSKAQRLLSLAWPETVRIRLRFDLRFPGNSPRVSLAVMERFHRSRRLAPCFRLNAQRLTPFTCTWPFRHGAGETRCADRAFGMACTIPFYLALLNAILYRCFSMAISSSYWTVNRLASAVILGDIVSACKPVACPWSGDRTVHALFRTLAQFRRFTFRSERRGYSHMHSRVIALPWKASQARYRASRFDRSPVR